MHIQSHELEIRVFSNYIHQNTTKEKIVSNAKEYYFSIFTHVN